MFSAVGEKTSSVSSGIDIPVSIKKFSKAAGTSVVAPFLYCYLHSSMNEGYVFQDAKMYLLPLLTSYRHTEP